MAFLINTVSIVLFTLSVVSAASANTLSHDDKCGIFINALLSENQISLGQLGEPRLVPVSPRHNEFLSELRWFSQTLRKDSEMQSVARLLGFSDKAIEYADCSPNLVSANGGLCSIFLVRDFEEVRGNELEYNIALQVVDTRFCKY